MKKTLFFSAFTFLAGSTFAQNLPVSQVPSAKKAVIEEFTAYRCGNCPLGHELSNNVLDNLGEENALVIAYHVGGLAVPQNAGDPDFRTPEGNVLRNHFSVFGTPSGPVNRSSFGTASIDVSANNWSSNTSMIVNETADANVALDVSINHVTREVTISSEVFYTTNSADTHYLSIGYLEEGVIAPQTTYNTNWNSQYFYPNGDYYHRHVFRGFINSTEGDMVDASATGVITNNYTFTVPAEINGQPINIYSLEFFAILHEGLNGPTDSEIINAAKSIDPFVNIEELSSLELVVAPNPNNGTFTVQGLEDSDQVFVVDTSGRNVEFTRDGNQIEVARSGFYFLKVIGEYGSKTVTFTVN
ncbi:MAG: hypothetical protein DCO96_14215 [Fluviicola sp. XM-24bin1]|nr:MAG: hypothetical protein DCO96_14215 [Fluviicola sp. XM-24bin1]